MIAASLWFLYRVAFPALDGRHESLIYFREIAKPTESNFIDAFTTQDEGARVKGTAVSRTTMSLGVSFVKYSRISERQAAYAAPPLLAVLFAAFVPLFGLAFGLECTRGRSVFAPHFAAFDCFFAVDETP